MFYIADTAVAVTAGSGTNIDTRTEATNGNHRQVVVLGDPSTNAGVAPVDATNGVSVTLTTAIPAGSAAIGKLAANSGVDIGDVDVTSISAGDNNIGNVDIVTVPADPFGANADAVVAAGAAGSIQAKLRRLTTDIDAINTKLAGTLTVTGGGGGTEYTEDVATANPIVGTATMIERDDALSAVTPIEGDNIGLRGTAEGALWTQDFNSDAILADTTAIKTAVEILDNTVAGSELQVDIVSAPTLTVNAHAVTNAGTFATQVDGSALTALQLIDDTVATLGTTTYTEASTKGNVIGAVRRDADTTLVDTTNEVSPLQVDANGRLKVEAFSGETLPVSLTTTAVTNAGTFVVQENGAALTALQLIDDVVSVDDTATHTPATTKAANIALVADETSPDSVNEGDLGMPRMTLERFQVVTPRPTATGEGCDVANNLDVDETEDAVKASAGKLYGWFWYNDGASEVYIKYYNDTTANVVVGTTAATLTIGIPAGGASNIEWSNGIPFSTAITVAATTGSATADTGAPAASQVVGFSLYK